MNLPGEAHPNRKILMVWRGLPRRMAHGKATGATRFRSWGVITLLSLLRFSLFIAGQRGGKRVLSANQVICLPAFLSCSSPTRGRSVVIDSRRISVTLRSDPKRVISFEEILSAWQCCGREKREIEHRVESWKVEASWYLLPLVSSTNRGSVKQTGASRRLSVTHKKGVWNWSVAIWGREKVKMKEEENKRGEGKTVHA